MAMMNCFGREYYLFTVEGLHKRRGADCFGKKDALLRYVRSEDECLPAALMNITETPDGKMLEIIIRDEIHDAVKAAFDNDGKIFLTISSHPACKINIAENAITIGDEIKSEAMDYRGILAKQKP